MRPGQLRLEAVRQVEESPGQDDDVVHASMQDHHLAGIAETCAGTRRPQTGSRSDIGCDDLHKQTCAGSGRNHK